MIGDIKTEEQLREYLGEPSQLVQNKVIDHLDEHCRSFISKSPFLTISTADVNGYCDASPRGDAPGFVVVEDEQHLLIPERPGNKRADSLSNLLENPRIGLLFMIPGLGETLRINGRAVLITEPSTLEKMAVNGKSPLLAIKVSVDECFIHCAKAFIRSGLWKPDSWLEKEELPKPARAIQAHAKLPNLTEEGVEEKLKNSYENKLY
ncbi:pyridoxamine 5'-phosphate oxidase family protein [Jeotgalibacillus salarius]|uniref:Pyridoxamine 5'-phosphate oxidase family protein n=1 Tax=Jeotgalibacillus salarius TaxID=546023 RepID=A0A4Y8LHE4_9BACL|nr:pyridoxamine 5'-phosphate oxidase family protein [Jeotgalibacillus salarius]TFE02246.1 pyridoxamine 5'-phosphate oxidase family protein [Jeotgalibacillus salarius]